MRPVTCAGRPRRPRRAGRWSSLSTLCCARRTATTAGRTGQYSRLQHVENLHTLAPLLAASDERQRTVLRLRQGQELTQTEIGAHLGVSDTLTTGGSPWPSGRSPGWPPGRPRPPPPRRRSPRPCRW
ncbi:sigma factor-like helix-turn-helix DNA-binding protein [Streptomyces sp. DT117]|uniref:sigma factor-like helix-turn-helix DNA-binding protein n=1 Tax=Streptomyces sp. DT117 TaxID=3393422 RepID=UPI003CF105ED